MMRTLLNWIACRDARRTALLRGTVVLPVLAAMAGGGWLAAAAQEQPPHVERAGSWPTNLPWKSVIHLTDSPPASSRQALAGFGIGTAELDRLASQEPPGAEALDVLYRLLYRVPRLGLENSAAWQRPQSAWDEVCSTQEKYRGELFVLRGQVLRVMRHKLPADAAEQLEFAEYYEVSLSLAPGREPATIYARWVPTAWEQLPAPLDEPAAAEGLFLQCRPTEGGSELSFVASRIRWYPREPRPAAGLGPSHVALAERGVDAGQWELVREANRAPLGAADREAFYQVLNALGRGDGAGLGAGQGRALALGPLLENPEPWQGTVVPARGTARRIMKIAVDDPDLRARFGLDHYYEIDVFLPLGDTTIRFGAGDPERSPVYANQFPATLVVRALPPGLAEGENVHESIVADAVFFKLWTYRSVFASRFGQLQVAPLFLAASVELAPREAAFNPLVAGLTGGALLVAAVFTGIGLWWVWRGSQSRRRPPPGPQSRTPDFRNLAT
jgi:hypothetical protein